MKINSENTKKENDISLAILNNQDYVDYMNQSKEVRIVKLQERILFAEMEMLSNEYSFTSFPRNLVLLKLNLDQIEETETRLKVVKDFNNFVSYMIQGGLISNEEIRKDQAGNIAQFKDVNSINSALSVFAWNNFTYNSIKHLIK